MLNLNHKAKRDLLTGMDYVRDNSLVTQREYNYDALGRPTTRDTRYPDRAVHHVDAFAYNKRSELTGALLDGNAYTYAYDNIGNREIAQEAAEDITYDANDLNQYTRISTNGEDFTPEYDADGNQTLVQTTTGIWHVTYNGQNRAIRFESEDGRTVITCGYDYMGRRFEKKVTVDGTVTLHERYIYRGYLQIAALDMLHDTSLIHSIIWDPTQEIATRPLAIRENGTWYTYGWDLTKNICELYGQEGFIRTVYTYSPYGQVRENESTTQSLRGIGGGLDNAEALPEGRTADGAVVSQPIQWSSEMYDVELELVYYNYRYYNPLDGRWTRRDPEGISAGLNLYLMVYNNVISNYDKLGKYFIGKNVAIQLTEDVNDSLNAPHAKTPNFQGLIDTVDDLVWFYQCIKTMTVMSHGNSSHSVIGQPGKECRTCNTETSVIDPENARQLFLQFKKEEVFCHSCVIYWLSCETGNGVLPQVIASTTGCTVYAPIGLVESGSEHDPLNSKVCEKYDFQNDKCLKYYPQGEGFEKFEP